MTNTAWATYWTTVGNEDYLAAKKLLELSPRVESHFRAFATPDDVDWLAAIKALDHSGMSTTELNLSDIVGGLIAPSEGGEHLFSIRALGWMGSWTDDVLRILVEWATDKRLTVAGEPLPDLTQEPARS